MKDYMKKINLVGIIGGAFQVVSPFLAWVSYSYVSISLIDIIRVLNQSLSQSYWWYTPPPELRYMLGICILTVALLIVGGVVSFFRGGIGGALGIVGMFLITFMPWPGQTPDIPIDSLLSFLDIGYYLGWIGSIISLVSHFREVPIRLAEETTDVQETEEETQEERGPSYVPFTIGRDRRIEEIENEIRKTEGLLEKLSERMALGKISEEIYRELDEKYAKKKLEFEKQLTELKKKVGEEEEKRTELEREEKRKEKLIRKDEKIIKLLAEIENLETKLRELENRARDIDSYYAIGRMDKETYITMKEEERIDEAIEQTKSWLKTKKNELEKRRRKHM